MGAVNDAIIITGLGFGVPLFIIGIILLIAYSSANKKLTEVKYVPIVGAVLFLAGGFALMYENYKNNRGEFY